MAVACFYFDFAARKEQSATSMLGSLLKQVVSGMGEVPEEISRAFQEQGKVIGGRGPKLSDIVKMLQTTTSSRRTFIRIDALDECVGVHRAKILNSLEQILEKSPGMRIIVTGRPHIRAEIERLLEGRVISVSVGPDKNDIIRYLRVRLCEDLTPDAMDESLAADILEKIPGNISKMFLLVSLNVDAILQELTICRRREKLSAMTDGLGLGGAYGATVERIKAQDGDKSRLGMAALMWVSHAERPLQVDELCHALAVELGSTDFNTSNVPSISTLASCCQGLITVDKEASTVRLIHFTLHEYLSAHPDIFSRPHSTMAEICLTLLNSKRVKDLPADPRSDTWDIPFLDYCSVYWGFHAKRELSDCARSLALELFQDCDQYKHVSTEFLLAHLPLGDLDVQDCFRCCHCDWPSFSGLHCASFFGITELVVDLIQIECYDINKGDFSGRTPLAWASRNGHEEVVNVLLGCKGVNPDKPDYTCQTPFALAARNGHEGVVKILLGQEEVNPDYPNIVGETPLTLAALSGHEGMVKILLGLEEVNPDKQDIWGRTPLSHAAENGSEGVVKTLLGREEVSPDVRDEDGDTPLSHAALAGSEEVVRVLLGREEVNPNMLNNHGQTPLSCAAIGGKEGVVKILLEREEVSPDKPDDDGRTPLSYAARFGRDEVVKVLLGQGEINPDKPDYRGQTPLSLAAMAGWEGVVKILLEREEVNPDEPDDDGRTPLSYAASCGRDEVVKVLLGRDEINPDRPDYRGQTPLSFAAMAGREGVVKILLERGEVNPDEPDDDGRTPLSYAASRGRDEVVKVLLERKEVNPNKSDIKGQTPLSFAANRRHERVVNILLGREEANRDKAIPTRLSSPDWYHPECLAHLLRDRKLSTSSPI